jgi:hypothetical protein
MKTLALVLALQLLRKEAHRGTFEVLKSAEVCEEFSAKLMLEATRVPKLFKSERAGFNLCAP